MEDKVPKFGIMFEMIFEWIQYLLNWDSPSVNMKLFIFSVCLTSAFKDNLVVFNPQKPRLPNSSNYHPILQYFFQLLLKSEVLPGLCFNAFNSLLKSMQFCVFCILYFFFFHLVYPWLLWMVVISFHFFKGSFWTATWPNIYPKVNSN